MTATPACHRQDSSILPHSQGFAELSTKPCRGGTSLSRWRAKPVHGCTFRCRNAVETGRPLLRYRIRQSCRVLGDLSFSSPNNDLRHSIFLLWSSRGRLVARLSPHASPRPSGVVLYSASGADASGDPPRSTAHRDGVAPMGRVPCKQLPPPGSHSPQTRSPPISIDSRPRHPHREAAAWRR